ncbi:hypothetical protein HanIR_Chr15g0771951 [Helianthus annuus]|nr:hypothetical protein HanIR_Chr15g0771951 [Helianthus annuus]
MTGSSKDQHGHRRIILRCLMVEPWSNHIFRAPRRISSILRGYPSIQTTSCCPSQTRRIVDLVNLQTDLGHRLHTDRIQTKYRHKCTNKLPLGCSFVFILSLSSIDVDLSRTSTVFGLRVSKTLMSFQVFMVGGSSKSSRLESRECINKLPVSCRQCVNKLPLNISSPLSYAREIL